MRPCSGRVARASGAGISGNGWGFDAPHAVPLQRCPCPASHSTIGGSVPFGFGGWPISSFGPAEPKTFDPVADATAEGESHKEFNPIAESVAKSFDPVADATAEGESHKEFNPIAESVAKSFDPVADADAESQSHKEFNPIADSVAKSFDPVADATAQAESKKEFNPIAEE